MKRLPIFLLLSLLAFGSLGATGVSDKTCAEKCTEDNRQRVGVCNTVYPPESQVAKHRQCLDDAKTQYDACLAICRAN
jgi:hypothetical protein